MARKRRLGRPKGSSSEATAARVLDAARVCFSRSGYAAATNREIAEEAGVTTATIYLYFDSKTALYKATVRHAYHELLPHYRAAADAPSCREGLRAVLAASAPAHSADPSLAAFFSALPTEMRRHSELADVIREEGAEVVGLFAQLVDKGVRGKEFSSSRAPHVLSLFIACAMGLSLYVTSIDSSQFVSIIETFGALIDGTLFKPRRARAR